MNKILISIFFLCLPVSALAQDAVGQMESRQVQGEVLEIQDLSIIDGYRQMKFQVRGDDQKIYDVNTADSYLEGLRYNIQPGNRVILQIFPEADGSETAHLADAVRTNGLLWVLIVFSLLILIVGLWRGLLALLGLGITVLVLFVYIFPNILSGADPLNTVLLGSAVILAVNLPITHGFNKMTAMAFVGTLAGLALSVLTAKFFMAMSFLSGLGSEEAVYLTWQVQNIKADGLLLAAIVLGAVGVFDDVAINQATVVAELKKADPNLKTVQLARQAMRVGRHHIASMVNTLVLAYAAVAMPLFLLFLNSDVDWVAFVNTEVVAEEIVRTLAGTSALVLTVPISTWLAAWIATDKHGASFDNEEFHR
ncbi:YibE/F family protein [Patescibacteria group bacterium]|nr:YibE/F family protein [Patescibacteria group bacterium]MBU1705331.1 YibE/F family protein [Patescibacteria group bacterium]